MREKVRKRNISYTKIISVYLWICIAGLIISIPMFDNMINKHDLEISNDMCGLTAEKMNNSINFITEAVKGRAEILSSMDISDWDEMSKELSENIKSARCISTGLVDKKGNVYSSGNEAAEFEKWGFIRQAGKARNVLFTPPYREGVTGKMVVTIFSHVYQDGDIAGEFFMTFDLKMIQKMASSEILSDNMEIYLMNPYSNDFVRCFGPDKSLLGSWSNTKLLYGQIQQIGEKSYDEWLIEMRVGKNGSAVFYKQNGTVYTQVFVNISVMKDWSVVVSIPNDALSYNLRVFHMAIIVFIVVLIMSLFVLFLLSHRSAEEEKRKLEYLSIHDPLTTLPNRRAFEDIYEKSQKAALVFFDIDYFKQANDGFGHAMGDRVLCEFAEIGNQIFEENGILSRFGGDEFVLLIKELKGRERLEAQLEEFLRRLGELDFLVDEDGNVFDIHFSAGIVEVKDQGSSLEKVEKMADKALYVVKESGRNGYAWY